MAPIRNVMQQQFIDKAVRRAQAEILSDIGSGTLPESVDSFAALHDYVDANCYAGCCDDSTKTELLGLELWNSIFPRKAGEDHEVLGSEDTLEAINVMQSRLDHWLAAGVHRQSGDW